MACRYRANERSRVLGRECRKDWQRGQHERGSAVNTSAVYASHMRERTV